MPPTEKLLNEDELEDQPDEPLPPLQPRPLARLTRPTFCVHAIDPIRKGTSDLLETP